MTHLISGEIDIMEARGNGPEYPAQYADSFIDSVPLLTETVLSEAPTMFEDR